MSLPDNAPLKALLGRVEDLQEAHCGLLSEKSGATTIGQLRELDAKAKWLDHIIQLRINIPGLTPLLATRIKTAIQADSGTPRPRLRHSIKIMQVIQRVIRMPTH